MKNKRLFLDELNNNVLVGDGAMGTELFVRGAQQERGIERLNLISPETVLRLHQDYISAGSRVIETNTFGVNRLNLAGYGAENQLREIILAGVSLARQAAGDRDVYVAGSIGPLPMVDGEPVGKDEQSLYFGEQIEAILTGGADLLIIESFANLDEIVTAVSVARAMTDLPIVAQMSFDTDGDTASGDSAFEVAVRCHNAGADVVGANCGYGVPSITAALKQMIPHNLPMSAYMNAGFPEQVEGRMVYLSTPEYLARRAVDLVKLGVRLVGGCCGTSPETIHAISRALSSEKSPRYFIKPPALSIEIPVETIVCPKSSTITPGRILVELDSPSNLDVSPVLNNARILKESGVDAVTIADNPLATTRVDTLAMAAMIQQEAGMPVIPHLTGRDRNRIALQSTIMGAHVLRIRYILCVTGDPVRMCQDPNTSGVFDVTSVGLVRMVADFNSGHRLGESCRTAFSIGVALNPNVRSIGGQISKLQRKIEAGADFALTQPIYSEERLNILQEALDDAEIDIPIYIGILPLTSSRNAEFLHNEVPGIIIPDEIRQILAKYNSVGDQRKAAEDVITEFIRKISSRVHGFYVITPGNKVNMVLPLIVHCKHDVQ